MKLYHCTRLEYVDRIIQEGLKINHPQQRESKHKGIYLSEYQFNWMWNTTREGQFKGAIIKVDVTGLPLIDDYHKDPKDIKENSKMIGKDYICLKDVSPERITEIMIETTPNTFQKLVGWKRK